MRCHRSVLQSAIYIACTTCLVGFLLPHIALAGYVEAAEYSDDAASASLVVSDSITTDAITHRLAQARTMFWLGVDEHGNRMDFLRSLDHIDETAQLLENVASDLPEPFVSDTQHRLQTLRDEVQANKRAQSHRLYNVFPLLHGVPTSSLILTPVTGTRHLAEDPAVAAVQDAVQVLQDEVSSEAHVVVQSRPQRPALESEAVTLLSASPHFFLRTRDDVVAVLPDTAYASLHEGTLTASQQYALAEALDTDRLLVVTLQETPALDNVTAYAASGRLVSSQGTEANWIRSGFARDLRGQRLMLFMGHLLLLVAGILLVLGKRLLHTPSKTSAADVMFPVAAFAIGRMLPWGLMPVLQTVAPDPRALAWAVGWWPLLTGAVLLIGIPVLVGLIVLRIGVVSSVPFDRLLGAAGLGGAAYLLGPIVLADLPSTWILAVGIALTAGGIGVAVGHMLRPFAPDARLSTGSSPAQWAALAVGGGLVGSGLLFAAVPIGLLALGILVVGRAAWLVRASAVTTSEIAPMLTTDLEKTQDVFNVNPRHRLRRIKRRELYIPPTASVRTSAEASAGQAQASVGRLVAIHERVTTVANGKVAWLFLCGPSGVGKTATAYHLLRALRGQRPDVEWLRSNQGAFPSSLTPLHGTCPTPAGEPEAYAPFREALQSHFSLPATDSHEQLHGHLNDVLDDVVGTFVPFATLFLSPLDAAGSTTSPDEIATSIAQTLRTLAEKQPTLLFIDDIQWMDPDSTQVLHALLDAFPPGESLPLMVLFTSRTPPAEMLDDVGPSTDTLREATVQIERPLKADRMRLLTNGLGLAPASAEQIIDHLDGGTDRALYSDQEQQGELFWLLEVVEELLRGDHLMQTDAGWALPDTMTSIPVPNHFQDIVRDQLDAHPEFEKTLLYASCLGATFTLSVLTTMHEKNLSRSRVLDRLDDIERTLGWIQDDPTCDDVFVFASSFVLDALRDVFDIRIVGPDGNAPQRVREAHARAAHALHESSSEGSDQTLVRRANHLYSAGAQYAEEAVKTCRAAAQASRSLYAFDQAEGFLDKAEECAAYTAVSHDFEQDRLQLACIRAHVRKDDTLEPVATEGFEFLDAHPESAMPETVRAVLQAGYDAQKFEAVAERASHLAQDETVALRYRAEGYHFWGLAIDRSPATRDEREQHLRTALEILDDLPEQDRAAQRLRGRVMNSLAELLSRSAETDRERENARMLYEARLELNERLALGDQQGLAMTHGGLGRLFLYRPADSAEEAQKYAERARHHFAEDLKLAEALQDVPSQAQMHSHLGECALRLNDLEEARAAYQQSLELTSGWVGQVFAYAGLVRTCAALEDRDALREAVDNLIEAADFESLFPGLQTTIQDALQSAQESGCSIPIDRLPPSLQDALHD